MPSAKKVAWAQLRVGVVAVAAMAILAMLVFLITSGTTSLFAPKSVLYTYMGDSAAMTKGSNVRINGILAGEVTSIDLTNETDPRRVVKITMEIEQDKMPQIPVDSEVSVAAENLLGTKYLNIRKGSSTEHVQPGAEVRSQDTTGYEEVVASGYSLLESLQGMLKRLDAIVGVIEAGQGSIGKLIFDDQLYDNLAKTTAEAAKVTEALNSGKGTMSRLLYEDQLYNDMRGTMDRVNSLIDGLNAGEGTMGKLLKDPSLYNDMRQTIQEARTMLADLNAGKGTMGKLLKDESLHNEIASTVARMDSLLEKINTGEGTLGQLVVNPQLYESLNGTMDEMHQFMQDFRANPKKFLSIKLGLF